MEPREEKKYWSSLAQFDNSPQFIERSQKEFQSSPLQEVEEGKDGFTRRDFMKLMAASTALASSACFQKPAHKILPYVNQPEEITFGNANFYASTCGECASGCGTLVKTREGRPIKLEGNPDHPMNKGGLCARGQASILNLYDPDRLRNPVSLVRGSYESTAMTWADADKKIGDKLRAIKNGNGRVKLLTSTINSPSTLKLVGDFLRAFPKGEHFVYDPVSTETIAQAQDLAYGTKVLPRYRFDKADVIVSIDADFLGTWISPVEFTKQFSSNRKLDNNQKKLSKLYTFESMVTITGSNADERVGIRPEDGAAVALAIASELSGKAAIPAEALSVVKSFSASKVASMIGCAPELIKACAEELWKARGKSLVVAGSQPDTKNALALQLAVNLLNSILQNDGVTVDYKNSPSLQGLGSSQDLARLIKEMSDGQVDALLIYGVNPVYSLSSDLKFAEAAKKVKEIVISFNDRVDETGKISDYVLPDNHPLESWGDAEPQKGLYSLVQPTIRPVYDTRSFQDSLVALNKSGGLKASRLEGVHDFHEYLQNNWKETIYKENSMATPFEIFWESTLRDGVFDVAGKKGLRDAKSSSRSFKGSALAQHAPVAEDNTGYSLAIYAKISLHDGAAANNAWLQELPDPVTRLTWDNYANVSKKAADTLHLKDGDLIKIKTSDGVTLELPAHVQPGLHDHVVAVAMGYGREKAGAVGSGIGKNVASFKGGTAVTLVKTGATTMLASSQEHDYLEGRPIVKEASLKEYIENPRAGNDEKEELTTIWSGHKYDGYRWGMNIDLNSCTGCQACVIGCQSENNVPVVGKDGVMRGRIMHWIRIDRYYSGTPDKVTGIVHQPMLCQHCENAPCETVCPVIATMHDNEGLNVQVYNRCVGTRYCANNCPYKVRRFNWFDYNYGGQTRYPINLGQNPEVTVRSRGVMEKCTFCIQRISDAKNTAKNMGRPVKDGEVKTACQQSCPADAISFGNINDKDAEVTRLAQDARSYHVLEELNVRPSVTYLTKIKNSENV